MNTEHASERVRFTRMFLKHKGSTMGKLDGKKVLMVVASKDYRDEEYEQPRALLEREGAKVTVASSSLKKARGMLGGSVQPDILLKDAKAADYDCVIFVGGMGSTEYWNDAKAHALAKETASAGKVTAAICLAPVTLANAGLLKGKRCTVYSSEGQTLRAKGGNYTGMDVESDGNIITGSGPTAAREFGAKLVEALGGK
jgi:protease I